MANWRIDPHTERQWRQVIIGLHDLIYNPKDEIKSLPGFEYTKDLGIRDFASIGDARKIEVSYQGTGYALYIHFYNRDNGNCLAITNELNGRNLLQLVLDNYLEKTPFGARLWHDGKITGVANLTGEKLIEYVKEKEPDLVKNEANYGDYIEFGYINDKDKLSFSNHRIAQLLSNLVLFSILRHEIKKEYKSGDEEEIENEMEQEEDRAFLLVNITWNSKDWKEPSEDKSGHKYVSSGNIPHESWNFDFENQRNTNELIYGFGQFTNPPRVVGDNNLLIFYSQNQIVGFYGNAEVLSEAIPVNKKESYNLIGRKHLSVLLKNKIENVKEKGYLEDKQRVGQIGFTYLENISTVNRILTEALSLNPDESVKIKAIINWLNSDKSQADKKENHMETNNQHPLNQILFGPPGTGKTYNTISEAIKVVDPDFYKANASNRDKLQKRFNDLLIRDWKNTDGQIAFCTFHQSFSYEDFVEGIKPKTTNEKQVYYEIEDGIFKSICRKADAINNAQTLAKDNLVSLSQAEFNQAVFYKISLGDSTKAYGKEVYEYCIKNNVISIGFGEDIDFTDKSEEDINNMVSQNQLAAHAAQSINYFKNYLKVGNYVVVSNGNSYIRALGKVVGEYKYEDETEIGFNHFRKVEWIFKDVEIPVTEFYQSSLMQKTIYKLKKEFILPSFFVKAEKNAEVIKETKNFVIVIDEINRGNVSSIFGELITLIEPSKRAGKLEALEVVLPYSKEKFTVPSNVYVIGTMNTADRSIESLDTALRRRFSFKEMAPKSGLIKTEGASKGSIDGIDLVRMLDKINERIEKLIDKDHKIGHSYFINVVSGDDLRLAFHDKVIPLLEEYFFGDFGKIGLVLGSSFVKKQPNDFEFAKFEEYDSQTEQDLKSRAIYTIKPIAEWNFKSIYE